MGLRIDKPWIELGDGPGGGAPVAALPAQLGVFQLADADGAVVLIGMAGGRDRFGLRGAVAAAVDAHAGRRPRSFRYEITHGYQSRWRELLMVHRHDTGALPPGNDEPPGGLGRLRPGPAPAPSAGRTA